MDSDRILEIDWKVVAHNIRVARMMDGLTQGDFAKVCGISRTTVYGVELGHPVRLQTLRKIGKGSNLSIEMLCTSAQSHNIKPKDQWYIVHESEDTVWYVLSDRRKGMHPESQQLIQDPAERSRLGRAGLVRLFASSPNFLMPDGPGQFLIEVYGEFDGNFNIMIYRNCLLYCIRGEVLFGTEKETIHMRPGTFIGYDNFGKEFLIKPARPVNKGELPPLLMWTGANRVGSLSTLIRDDRGAKPEPTGSLTRSSG